MTRCYRGNFQMMSVFYANCALIRSYQVTNEDGPVAMQLGYAHLQLQYEFNLVYGLFGETFTGISATCMSGTELLQFPVVACVTSLQFGLRCRGGLWSWQTYEEYSSACPSTPCSLSPLVAGHSRTGAIPDHYHSLLQRSYGLPAHV